MFKRVASIEILNPGLIFFVHFVIFALIFEEYRLYAPYFLSSIFFFLGLYIGDSWRLHHELWSAGIRIYFRDGRWLSEKARLSAVNRKLHFVYWLFSRIVWITLFLLFLSISLALFNVYGIFLWEKFPTKIAVVLLIIGLTILSIGLPALFLYLREKIKNSNNFLSRIENTLEEFRNLDSELDKLKEQTYIC